MFGPLRAIFLFATAFIAAPFYLAHSQTSPAVSSPQLAIDRTRHNFGEVFTGEIISTSFRVRNLGTKALELSDRPLLVPTRAEARRSESGILASIAKASLNTPRRAAPS